MRSTSLFFSMLLGSLILHPGKSWAGPFEDNYRAGMEQLQSGHNREAAILMNDALRSLKDPDKAPDPTIYNNFGWVLMKQGDFVGAQQAFDRAERQKQSLPPREQQRLEYNRQQLARLRR